MNYLDHTLRSEGNPYTVVGKTILRCENKIEITTQPLW